MFKKHLKDHFDTIRSVPPGLDKDFIFRFKALYYEVQLHSSNPVADNLNQVLDYSSLRKCLEGSVKLQKTFKIFDINLHIAFKQFD